MSVSFDDDEDAGTEDAETAGEGSPIPRRRPRFGDA